jgi:aspartate kinase
VPQLNWQELAKSAKAAGFAGVDLTVRRGGHVAPPRATEDLPKAVQHIHPAAQAIGASTVVTDDRVGKVSIVGTGVANTPGYASRMFRALTDAQINIQLITTSEIQQAPRRDPRWVMVAVLCAGCWYFD